MSAQDKILNIRLYHVQWEAWSAAARYENMSLSAFIRHIMDRTMQHYEDILDFPDPAEALLRGQTKT